MEAEAPLLALRDFGLRRADGTAVLEGVTCEVARGEIVGVVGESGSGKTQLLLSLLGLAMPGGLVTGQCLFDGHPLPLVGDHRWRTLRGRRIAMLFQDPLLSWNPYLTMGRQLREVPALAALGRADRDARVCAALAAAGLENPADLLGRHPHELSGGMRQRALLAMALLAEPALLLADEPTTALDALTQVAVLDLLAARRRQHGTAVLIVTHDLGVVARIADRMLVMHRGRVVEQGSVRQVLSAPRADYTRQLVAAARALEFEGAAP